MPIRTSLPDTSFSRHFGVTKGPGDDWFDPLLHQDTSLFVDPFLMFKEMGAPWAGIHQELLEFFNLAVEHVASSDRGRHKAEYTKALEMFSFPEPPQLCLGYGEKTIFGSGSGGGLGSGMAEAADAALVAGIRNLGDFGDLMLFGENFGCDRVSDMVCNISKRRFVEYTQAVAARHALPTEDFRLPHLAYDSTFSRWESGIVNLPRNPCWGPRPVAVILVPARFLADLPKLDDDEFWDWVYNNRNDELRRQLGYTITKGLKKKDLIALAKRRSSLRSRFGRQYAAAMRSTPPDPYDVQGDPQLKRKHFDFSSAMAAAVTASPPSSAAEMSAFVRSLVNDFKVAIEAQGHWKSFWIDVRAGRHHDEPQVQRLFHLSCRKACELSNIDVSPESNAGGGAVDFKFSAGYDKRSVVEFKLAESTHLLQNAEHQTPAYMRAEDVQRWSPRCHTD